MLERFTMGLEVRAEAIGRKLSGTVLRYGDVSPSHRERFMPGSIEIADNVHLDLDHDVERVVAYHPRGGLELSQSDQELSMRAVLPPIPAADRALADVRSGRAGGLSVEFQSLNSSRDGNGVRVIKRARLHGIGIVKRPSYPQSKVETRQKAFLRSRIPINVSMPCDCLSDPNCRQVSFVAEAMRRLNDEMSAMFESAQQAAQANIDATRAADIMLLAGRGFESAVASARRGTLRSSINEHGDLVLDAVAPDTPRAVSEMMNVPLFVRPIISEDDSEFTEAGGVRVYKSARTTAFLLKAIAGDPGAWPEAAIQPPEQQRSAEQKIRRRVWL